LIQKRSFLKAGKAGGPSGCPFCFKTAKRQGSRKTGSAQLMNATLAVKNQVNRHPLRKNPAEGIIIWYQEIQIPVVNRSKKKSPSFIAAVQC
jgi:hypothetical protein